MPSLEDLQELAGRYLSPAQARAWLDLVRPAFRLSTADADGGSPEIGSPEIGQLGGDPHLPCDVEWPIWPDHGPLSFIASVQCARLPKEGGPKDIPQDGSLLFFYFDGRFRPNETSASLWEWSSRLGVRVLYVEEGVATEARSHPTGLKPYPERQMYAKATMTPPDASYPEMLHRFGDSEEPGENPLWREEFLRAAGWAVEVGEVPRPAHQLGGQAKPIQEAPEFSAARRAIPRNPGDDWNDPEFIAETRRWILLAQIDSDRSADMVWGDVGTLYWMIRPEDLAARRFDEVAFTWQCT